MELILVVDDDPGFRRLLETILRNDGYTVDAAGSVRDAIARLEKRKYHLALSDLKLPDGDGLSVLRWISENTPETPVVMITAFGTVSNAVEAMKLGAVDYLGKPLSSPEELRLLVRRTLDNRAAVEERNLLRDEQEKYFSCDRIVAEDPAFLKTLELSRKVAPTEATVLLLGESGTGKELLAHCLHNHSRRAQRQFVPVNCASLSPTLIESELFGHEKGSFTGAVRQHTGLFERAHMGTIFLDEIGELDLNLQAKLLRVLQERTFERVGGTRQITVDVRLIAATNRNLKAQVAEGKFREDLYYRLSAFPIEIPPLRERLLDIAPLARYFLGRAAAKLGKPAPRLMPDAVEAFERYGWPGNVRELENLMERVTILCDDTIRAADLPLSAKDLTRPLTVREMEKQAIEEALRRHGGNRTRAAQELGISLRTLQYRLKEYALSAPEEG